MSASSVTAANNAKIRPRTDARANTQECGLIEKILFVAQTLWPTKQKQQLAVLAGCSHRSTERWGDGGGMSAEALANLIRSEEGFRFLCAVMEESRPRWWRLFEALADTVEGKRLQAAANLKFKRALNGALDADRDLSAAADRAEAALAFSDENFMRPHVDALRTVSRLPNRAVAQAAKGQRR